MAVETFIRWYDDALSEAFCRDVIARFERDGAKRPGRVAAKQGNVVRADYKQTTEVFLNTPGWADVETALVNNLADYLKRYREDVRFLQGLAHKDVDGENFRIKKYDPGDSFEWHIDCPTLRTITRVLAVQWYFNDVTEGGDTEFLYQDAAIRPRTGRIAFFPVGWTYRHRGAAPRSGPKYVCTNFLHPAPD